MEVAGNTPLIFRASPLLPSSPSFSLRLSLSTTARSSSSSLLNCAAFQVPWSQSYGGFASSLPVEAGSEELQDVFTGSQHDMFHKAMELQHSLADHQMSMGWWSLAFPFGLWYLFASPGSMAGVLEFLSPPFHSRTYREFSADNVEIGRLMGEGSFGMVFEGFIGQANQNPRKDGEHVVLKKAKVHVTGASEMHDLEIRMNSYLQRIAPGICAEFLGTMHVSSTKARGKLSQGTWLVWRFQGHRTLDYYMKQKIFPDNIGFAMLGGQVYRKKSLTQEEIIKENGLILRKIMRQIIENLEMLHRVGVVHRDLKPLNVILDEDSGKLKFIDLGACVDLRSGYNYVPSETVIDPTYAAPEHYVMPTSTPPLPPDPLCSLISPLLWLLNTPDRFDLFSAGLILMQLFVKPLRHDAGLQKFNAELKQSGYDLNAWRKKSSLGEHEFALLDSEGGAGWELARALLQPRHDRKFFIWPSLGASRPSAAMALRYQFFEGLSPRTIPWFSPDVSIFKRALGTVEQVWSGAALVIIDIVKNCMRALDPGIWFSLQRDRLLEAAQLVSSMEDSKTKKVTAILPTTASYLFALTSCLLVFAGLENSAHVSYEVGKSTMESIGISGTTFIAYVLIFKPWLEQLERKQDKEVSVPVTKPHPSVRDDGNYIYTRKPQIQELASIDLTENLESVSLRNDITNAILAMESQLDSLEASLHNGQQFSSQQQQLLAKMEKLLLHHPREDH